MQAPSFALSRRRWLTTMAAPLLAAPAWSTPGASGDDVANVLAPLLASVYTGQVDPALCLVSEKYDGVRAVWDGRVLRHRSGRPVSAPASFIDALPSDELDGELWLGRDRFEAISALVRKAEPSAHDWAAVRYMVFEMPGTGGTFAERAVRITELVARRAPSQLVAAEQVRIGDRAELQRRLEATVAAGGEGLMLHLASAAVAHGRNDVLMKLKPHLDAEATVIGYRRGAGKYGELIGALEVRAPDGRRFFVGSGLSDAMRREPPSLGASITYRYRDLTSTGLPRFATFLRRDASL